MPCLYIWAVREPPLHFVMGHNLITAEQRGISIGEKRGEERGITMGEKRGEERREAERKETVMAFKSKGVPVDAIVEVMKLTPDEIKSMGLLPDKKRAKKTPRSPDMGAQVSPPAGNKLFAGRQQACF